MLIKEIQAFVRDTKEYIQRNAPRHILVGGTMDFWVGRANITIAGPVNYLSCSLQNETSPSSADYISFRQIFTNQSNTVELESKILNLLALNLANATVPTWLSSYGSCQVEENGDCVVSNETLQETKSLYDGSNLIVSLGGGKFAGGARQEWLVDPFSSS